MTNIMLKILSVSALAANALAIYSANSTCLLFVYEPEAPATIETLVK